MSPSIAGATTIGARRGEDRGGHDVPGEPVGHRAEPVRGRGRDHDRIGGVGDHDVADPPVGEQLEDVRLDRMARQRRERERADEPRRGRAEHHGDVGALGAQEPEQLDGLVGGDRAGDAEGDEPTFEPTAGRRVREVRHGSPSSSRSPPATSAWRMARPLSVRSGSIASMPSSAAAHGAATGRR